MFTSKYHTDPLQRSKYSKNMGSGEGQGLLGCGASVAKIILFVFNFVFWLSGAALLAVGIWAKVDSSSLSEQLEKFLKISSESNNFDAAAILFIVVGVFIFIVGFCGCCGAIKESRCLLGIYILLLVLVLLAEIAAVILAVVYRGDLEDAIKEGGRDYLKKEYNSSFEKATDRAWNVVMQEFKCCGMTGPQDFVNSTFSKNAAENVPVFCCKTSDHNETFAAPVDSNRCYADANACLSGNCRSSDFFYHEGCYQRGIEFIKENSVIFIGIGAGLGGLELFGLLFAICLCRAIGKDDY